MPEKRFFLESCLSANASCSLVNEEMHHLRVMRPKIGTEIELINGKGYLANGTITSIEKKEICIHINEVFHEPKESFSYIIAQGMPHLNRLETILEKGTELGMNELWLFFADKSEKKGLSQQAEIRIKNILIASMKQCGRLYLPEVKLLESIPHWTNFPYPAFFGAFGKDTPSFFSTWKKLAPQEGAIFIIGPESGLSEKEEAKLKDLKCHPVTLHKNILRTDTAPLAALALMHHFNS